MQIRPQDAVAQEEHDGRTFYFCSRACHNTFLNDPHRYGHPSLLSPGDPDASLTVTLSAGEYELWCPVGSHRSQGMDTTVTVG